MQHLPIFLLCLSILTTGCSGTPQPAPTAVPATLAATTKLLQPTTTSLASPTTTPNPTPTQVASATPTTIPSPTPGITADVVLVGATLIDGSGNEALQNSIVTIKDSRIIAIGTVGSLAIDPLARRVDLTGKTILPGLINTHAHTDRLSDDELRAFTRAGVTTVRDLAGPLDLLSQRVQRFSQVDDPSLPQLRIAGPMITVPGGHPIPIYGLSDEVVAVASVEEARAAAELLLDAGVHHLKIAVSGRSDVQWPELSNQQIQAITDAAHARGARVTAHVDRAVALERAVLAGIDDAAHMPRDRMSDELIELMVIRGVALTPTMDVYENLAEERGNRTAWRQTTLPIMADNLRRFVAAGGIVALGDDYGNPRVALGYPADEIEKWIDAGLTPMQVLVAATYGGAVVCGIKDQVGILQPGMIADILILDGNPLEDIRALARVTLVLRSGRIAYQP